MRLIDADALDAAFTALRFNSDGSLKHWGNRPDWCLHGNEIETLLKDAPTVGGLVKCKDCKHCGVKNGATPFDIVWPDGVCPCRSDDPYYSWIPDGDWYCADGERREVG